MKKTFIAIQNSDPDKCRGHVWRHLCVTRRDGREAKKDCRRGLAGGCDNLVCVNCGGMDKDRREYRCFKCNHYFFKFRDLDTDKPTCDNCFKKLLSINTLRDYREFIG